MHLWVSFYLFTFWKGFFILRRILILIISFLITITINNNTENQNQRFCLSKSNKGKIVFSVFLIKCPPADILNRQWSCIIDNVPIIEIFLISKVYPYKVIGCISTCLCVCSKRSRVPIWFYFTVKILTSSGKVYNFHPLKEVVTRKNDT